MSVQSYGSIPIYQIYFFNIWKHPFPFFHSFFSSLNITSIIIRKNNTIMRAQVHRRIYAHTQVPYIRAREKN
jgi:hypothetical protein